jgi:hypothetical protein
MWQSKIKKWERIMEYIEFEIWYFEFDFPHYHCWINVFFSENTEGDKIS